VATEHLYVFCAVRGRPAPRQVTKLPAMPGGSRPRVVPLSDDISLVVGDVPAADYSGAAIEKRLTDLDWVARCGAAHHAVSDRLAEKHVVVPFRLFTLFSSEAKATAALGKASARIDKALERVKGKQEWVLRIARPGPEAQVKAPAAGAASAASGTAFLRAKADARKADAERATRVRAEAAKVFDALSGAADDSNQRAIEPGTGLLLDAAFLVKTSGAAAFKKTLTRAAASLLQDGCRVSLTGPWPPYSFVSLDSGSRRG
jgi:Gas vesicle synthesis protein GvpL/GvpF